MPRTKHHIKWVALSGSFTTENSAITYTPKKTQGGLDTEQLVYALLRSDKSFQRGTVSFEAQLKGAESRCQLILNQGLDPEVFVGLNLGAGAYGMAFFRNNKWEPIATSGYGDHPKLNTWLKVSIVVHGSSISLFVEGVKVTSGLAVIQESQLGLFLHGSEEVQVRNFVVHEEKPKVFIVMQFTPEFNSLYKDVIQPTCEKFGYQVIRGDDVYTNGLIIDDITKSIEEASVIIADITPDNPNVYYEVGYAHAIAKPTILLCEKKRERLPFDVSGFRTLFYDNTIGGKSQIEERLTKHLENIKG